MRRTTSQRLLCRIAVALPKFDRATSSRYGGCANNPGAIKMKMHPHFRYRTEPKPFVISNVSLFKCSIGEPCLRWWVGWWVGQGWVIIITRTVSKIGDFGFGMTRITYMFSGPDQCRIREMTTVRRKVAVRFWSRVMVTPKMPGRPHLQIHVYREFNYLGRFISTNRAFLDTLHGHKYYVDLKTEPRPSGLVIPTAVRYSGRGSARSVKWLCTRTKLLFSGIIRQGS